MKRPLLIVLVVGVLLAVGAGVYVVRTRARTSASSPPIVQDTMPNMPAAPQTAPGHPRRRLAET